MAPQFFFQCFIYWVSHKVFSLLIFVFLVYYRFFSVNYTSNCTVFLKFKYKLKKKLSKRDRLEVF